MLLLEMHLCLAHVGNACYRDIFRLMHTQNQSNDHVHACTVDAQQLHPCPCALLLGTSCAPTHLHAAAVRAADPAALTPPMPAGTHHHLQHPSRGAVALPPARHRHLQRHAAARHPRLPPEDAGSRSQQPVCHDQWKSRPRVGMLSCSCIGSPPQGMLHAAWSSSAAAGPLPWANHCSCAPCSSPSCVLLNSSQLHVVASP